MQLITSAVGRSFLFKRENPRKKNSSLENTAVDGSVFGSFWERDLMASGTMIALSRGWRTGVASRFFPFFFASNLHSGKSEDGIFLADTPHFPSTLSPLEANWLVKMALPLVASDLRSYFQYPLLFLCI